MTLKSYDADQWSNEVYQGLHKLDVSDMLAFLEGDDHRFLDHIGFGQSAKRKERVYVFVFKM